MNKAPEQKRWAQDDVPMQFTDKDSIILHHDFRRSAQDQKRLQESARQIDQLLEQDECTDEVYTRVSTVDNGEYNLQADKFHLERHGRIIPIPQAIFDQLDYVTLHTSSGLFPEINRAWITIDNRLFLWNYVDGSREFTMFDELSQIIISTAIVKPKQGTFPSQVKFVVVVATPVEIVMLQCLFEDEQVFGELELIPSKYSVSSDNVHITKIQGTEDGRIFMCGKDGNIYELEYDAMPSWFSREYSFKCRKLNRTASRLTAYLPPLFAWGGAADPIVEMCYDDQGFLYTVSAKSTISVYAVSSSGLVQTDKVANVLSRCSSHLVNHSINNRDWLDNFSIVGVSPVSARKPTLVAITNHAHRIFFVHTDKNKLKIKFIRLCPPQRASLSRARVRGLVRPGYKEDSPNSVRRTFCRDGVTMLVNSGPESDELIALVADVSNRTRLVENVEQLRLSRPSSRNNPVSSSVRVLDIAEIPPESYMSFTAASLCARGSDVPLEGLTEFAVQHALPHRKFLCLTRAGIFEFRRLRPVDLLRRLLTTPGNNQTLLKEFFEQHGNVEACCMCLILACSVEPYTEYVSQALAVSGYADNESFHGNTSLDASLQSPAQNYHDVNNANVGDDDVESLAAAAFFEYGGTTLALRENNNVFAIPTYGRMANAHSLGSSDKIAALYQLTSRLLRPVWSWSVIDDIGDAHGHDIELRFAKEQLLDFKAPLLRVRGFIHRNRMNLLPRGRESKNAQASLESLVLLLDICIEAFSLLVVLAERNLFASVITRLEPSEVHRLQTLTFAQFTTDGEGEKTIRLLINAMDKSSNDETWVEELHDQCPHFFGETDLLYYRALTNIRHYRLHYAHVAQRERYIAKAREFYKVAARSRKFQLSELCRNLREVHDYPGAIDLCLTRYNLLHMRDIPQLELSDTQEDSYVRDEQKSCLKEVINTLNCILRYEYPPGEEPTSDSLPLGEDEISDLQTKSLDAALASKSYEFHSQIYAWLVHWRDPRLYDRLFRIKNPFLLRFLKENDEELLLEYYEKNQLYKEAALLYKARALKPDDRVLRLRMMDLSKGLTNAQIALRDPYSDLDHNIVEDLRERITPARIQLKMLDIVHRDLERSALKRRLETQLLPLEELLREAISAKMWEVMLEIYYKYFSADHIDKIKQCYRNILTYEYNQSVGHGPDAWRPRVQEKFCSLVKTYLFEDKYIFPLDSLVYYLEELNYAAVSKQLAQRVPPTSHDLRFVSDTYRKAHVPLSRLLQIYSRYMEATASKPQPSHKHMKVFVCYTLYFLLEERYNTRERSRLSPRDVELAGELANQLVPVVREFASEYTEGPLCDATRDLLQSATKLERFHF